MPVVTGSAVGGARTGLASAAAVRSGSALPSEGSSRFSFRRAAYSGAADFLRPVTWSVVTTTDGELWMIGGIWPIGPASTVYVGGGGPDARMESAQTPVPPGTVKRLRFGADTPPGSGQSYAYTLFKNGVATSCTFTVTGSTRKGGSDVEVTCNDGDELCVRVVVSAGAPQANHSGSLQFAPAV